MSTKQINFYINMSLGISSSEKQGNLPIIYIFLNKSFCILICCSYVINWLLYYSVYFCKCIIQKVLQFRITAIRRVHESEQSKNANQTLGFFITILFRKYALKREMIL